ncbi:aldo/keto reductase [Planomicrobium sp. CPCC 101110]|uniref:aldo/keto reductase n=1 Tax=Planomicrobium sp. CPCC 101110 TaxID=2599619 RepID=UPI0011B50368|nr:aldo/keto reductase [Planomicrobium sp. CPCC 101110]TWT25943.1 aldo/keto reductase [Planomicrobium sp. CPCC 101110]
MDQQAISKALQQQTVTLPDGTRLPAIGQGTWNIGDDPSRKNQEIAALRRGLELGMTVIDTAEMYGEGKSEQLVGEAIQGKREQVFLVSKAYPQNAGLERIKKACENSLKRLGTDSLDLYLLHWRGRVPLAETVEGMEQLKAEGKIKRWGVSNFDTADMEELWSVPNGSNCATNQVLYHLGSRGIEYDLKDWHKAHSVPIMAYSPLAQGGSLRRELLTNAALKKIADKHHAAPLQIALAWTLRSGNVLAIPKAGQAAHVEANAQAAAIELAPEDLKQLDQAFPGPGHKTPLDII